MDFEKEIAKIEQSTLQAANKIVGDAVLGLLNADGHSFSKRPCQTCTLISELVQQPFGCVKKAIEAAERVKDKAEFLWPYDDGSVEEAGYEFANAKTAAYQEEWWNTLCIRIAHKHKQR